MASLRVLLATVVVVLLAVAFAPTAAADPIPLRDFCVADLTSEASVNGPGLPCKNPKAATADDFFFPQLRAGNTADNKLGSSTTMLDAAALPGFNTLGISLGRIGFAPGGVNPPHVHPHATEVINVLRGTLRVGFVSSDNKLFAKTLQPGDVFVFPAGLVHFQLAGSQGAMAISTLNSQSPGTVVVGDAMFGAKPSIPDEVLKKVLNVKIDTINEIKAQFK